ncbi:MAG: 2-oxoacid:acceptor oxidoreductase subunit alpha [Aigarchaeota archaeon]|nr:2-oxoacid:acceptor oxidoreductase subunit alpha [Aigarchaeota archaeon]MCX8192829.1 2-oxoacid:acceptor oxidoreductase subunit alpha [Nitrososphaeria archaeon]MDW7986073.1 2-oxoacid:ferredoxin oxidoreductase subunit alpha [Nitrososphaerota archaeon]
MYELSIIIGGPQGSGLETSASILTYSLARSGYGVLSDREYFSNIKGRHSYVHLTISSEKIPTFLTYPVQLVAGLDHETIFTHFESLEDGGVLVYDLYIEEKTLDTTPSMEEDLKKRLNLKFKKFGIDGSVKSLIKYISDVKKIKPIGINYSDVINEVSKKIALPASQAARYTSSIVIGAVAGLLNINKSNIEYSLIRRFGDRRELIQHNKIIIDLVYDKVVEEHGPLMKLERSKLDHRELMIASGNDVIAMAKIVGGLRYQSYYPITPAADESFMIESYEKLEVDGKDAGSVVVIQTEDEIAAIASTIGAALTGARASTSTSGPGFSLMVEGLGWAGMNEVPIVITYYQRGGPSTGLPTRGSQSDLLFTLYASHGEFPRIVLASGDHTEAFYDAIEAFNLAERYQTPVIHLLDKFLANSIKTLVPPDLSSIVIDRGDLLSNVSGEYRRFDISKTISPRAVLGANTIMWYTGDEHDEFGHIDEDPENREQMYRKRMEKLRIADEEIPEEKRMYYYGVGDEDVLLVGWGFVKGVAIETVNTLYTKGIRAGYLHIKMFSPFPSKSVKNLLNRFEEKKIIAVEHNYLAQSSIAVRSSVGVEIKKSIVKYTGRPIYKNELVEAVLRVLEGEDRVVLRYGP